MQTLSSPRSLAPAAGCVRDVLVAADASKPGVEPLLGELVPWLEARGLGVRLERDAHAFSQGRGREGDPAPPACDLAIVLGGDGAILGVVRAYGRDPVPTLGINFGRIGFLASTPASHWREALAGILEGRGVVEERLRLEARLGGARDVRAVALNEVAVQRSAHQGMPTIGLYVDGDWVTDYRADGLILATPSGSTAHSLSAGGPILAPDVLALVATAMCPQGLAHRPLVLHADAQVEMVVVDAAGITTLVVDGQGFFRMERGQRVHIRRHPVPYPLLAWPELDAYRRLRERLGWSGQVTPEQPGPAQSAIDSGTGGVL